MRQSAIYKQSTIYKRAAELLYTHGWTQGAHAHNGIGFLVGFDSPDAACFCAEGALLRIGGRHLLLKGVGPDFVGFNDAEGRTRDEVSLALLFESELLASEGM